MNMSCKHVVELSASGAVQTEWDVVDKFISSSRTPV
jgi:hypothetical protein